MSNHGWLSSNKFLAQNIELNSLNFNDSDKNSVVLGHSNSNEYNYLSADIGNNTFVNIAPIINAEKQENIKIEKIENEDSKQVFSSLYGKFTINNFNLDILNDLEKKKLKTDLCKIISDTYKLNVERIRCFSQVVLNHTFFSSLKIDLVDFFSEK